MSGGKSAKFFLTVVVALLFDIKVDQTPLKRGLKRVKINEFSKQSLLLFQVSRFLKYLKFHELDRKFIL